MSATPETLYEAVQAEIAKYPTRRGAVLPALHLTQEAYGWLSPEALEACSDAIGFSPAYCQSVASFYDMFFLEPVGAHVIDVCTNLACALCGAGELVEAFEQELGVRIGGTTDDGRSRCARPSAWAAARGRPSWPSTSATASASHPRTCRRSSARRAQRPEDVMPEWTPRLEANVLLDFEGELRDIGAYEAYGGYAQLRRAQAGMDAES